MNLRFQVELVIEQFAQKSEFHVELVFVTDILKGTSPALAEMSASRINLLIIISQLIEETTDTFGCSKFFHQTPL